MTALQDLLSHRRETAALEQIAGRLGWDQETVMPRGAAPQRAEEIGALETVIHARRTDPRIADWLAAAVPDTDEERAHLREIARSYTRATAIPADLAAEFARTASLAQGIWADARAAEDFDAFAPTLEKVIALRRQMGAAVARNGDPYDGLVEDYEPGTSAADIETLFGALRPRLVALAGRIAAAGPGPAPLNAAFDEALQMRLSTELATTFGYDLTQGRIDKAVHPFSSGSGQDVRITTRTVPSDPFNCFFSTIHEVGHASYEQAVDDRYLLSALGVGASMGVHESQSRIYENQIGRSRAFAGHLFGRMREVFGDFGIPDADAFYGTVNRASPGYIRTEASEVHYNLHIMLRFDLERALISGDLSVADLPGAWNDRFAADFGIKVDKPSHGCLQDVHWSLGYFGYFPTYTLGNVYAGCLNAAMREALPDLDADLARGDTSAATGWLRANLQQYGALRSPRETIEHATGAPVSHEPLLDYLDQKFAGIYGF